MKGGLAPVLANQKYMVRLVRVSLFALLVAIVVGLPLTTVRPLASEASNLPSQTVKGAPPALSVTGTFTSYLPFVSRSVDLAISGVKLMQGTSADGYAPYYIQNRAATLIAFVSLTGADSQAGVTGRLWAFNGSGGSLGTLDSLNSITAPSNSNNMTNVLKFSIPAGWMVQNYTFYIVVNPDSAIPWEYAGNNRYPATGNASFNVTTTARPLDVVIVPIWYMPFGAVDAPPQADPYNESYLQSMPIKLLPVPNVNYTVHSQWPYTPSNFQENLDAGSGTGWYELLNQLSALHSFEAESNPSLRNKVYYGVVDISDLPGGCPNCYTGLSWLGGLDGLGTGVGWSGDPDGDPGASKTMTHELGHTFGRDHVRCPLYSDLDPYDAGYPYSAGDIGKWGVDVTDGTLFGPFGKSGTYSYDYMSYCTPVWTSDYTYNAISVFRGSSSYSPVTAQGTPVEAIYVSGIMDASGKVTLRPVSQLKAMASNKTTGTHVLEVLGKDGGVLASYPFTPARIADSNGASGFGFFVPAAEGITGLRVTKDGKTVGEKIVTALPSAASFRALAPTARRESQGVVLRWTPVTHPTEPIVYSVRISHDGGTTWTVLALDLHAPMYTAPPSVDLSNVLVEIQASDGIHVTTQTLTINQAP